MVSEKIPNKPSGKKKETRDKDPDPRLGYLDDPRTGPFDPIADRDIEGWTKSFDKDEDPNLGALDDPRTGPFDEIPEKDLEGWTKPLEEDKEKDTGKKKGDTKNDEKKEPKPSEKEKKLENTKDIEKKPEKAKTPEENSKEGPIDKKIDTTKELNDARSLYLKALRLRGNVFRGALGRMFGRTLEFEGEQLDFGGPRDLERVRRNYEEKLKQERQQKIAELEDKLDGEALNTPKNREKITRRIISLMSAEQKIIDEEAAEGIEKGILEKLKAKWRQLSKWRLFGGVALAGAAAATGGTAIAAGAVGARAILGGVGAYTGVEAGIERYSKLLGHKGLIDDIAKEINTDDVNSIRSYISKLDINDVQKETARLRMLGVEKGINIGSAGRSGEKTAMIVDLLVKRDLRNTARQISELPEKMSKGEKLAAIISKRLSTEESVRNMAWEDETDREHIKKLGRKVIAAAAGGTVGWLIGSSIFPSSENVPSEIGSSGLSKVASVEPTTFDDINVEPQIPVEPIGIEPTNIEDLSVKPQAPVESPEIEPTPVAEPVAESVVPEILTDLSVEVKSGDNLWKLIENNMDNEGFLKGMNEGQRTFAIDRMKDVFAEMNATQLHEVGINSGDIDLIRVGEVIDLSPALGDQNFVVNALEEARNLSSGALQSIRENNQLIRQWLTSHPGEFLSSEKVADILGGRA